MRASTLHARNARHSAAFAFIYVILTVVALCAVVPILWVTLTAFKNSTEMFKDPFGLPTVWRWGNFPQAWFQGHFNAYFLNTVFLTVPAVVLGVGIAAACGYALAKIEFPGRGFVAALFVAGLAIPLYSIIIPLWNVLHAFGLVENLGGVILAEIGTGLPFGVMLMRSFFLGVEKDFLDSGRVDGCNELGTFSRIVLPLAEPAVMSLVIFTFQAAWNSFLLPLLITHEESKRTLNIGLMFFKSQFDTEYGLLAAGALIATFPIVVIYIAFNRYFIEGVAAGGLKG